MGTIARDGLGVSHGQGPITALLVSWGQGDREAANALFPLLYEELKGIAHRQLRRRPPGHTLSTTAVVHEAYLKLVDQTRVTTRDRDHFKVLAARIMRQILVDYSRRRVAAKRGGGARRASLDLERLSVAEPTTEVVALDQALQALECLDSRLAQVVELRVFGGLSVEEAAETLESSPRTVKRDWQKARAFLYRELSASGDADAASGADEMSGTTPESP